MARHVQTVVRDGARIAHVELSAAVCDIATCELSYSHVHFYYEYIFTMWSHDNRVEYKSEDY